MARSRMTSCIRTVNISISDKARTGLCLVVPDLALFNMAGSGWGRLCRSWAERSPKRYSLNDPLPAWLAAKYRFIWSQKSPIRADCRQEIVTTYLIGIWSWACRGGPIWVTITKHYQHRCNCKWEWLFRSVEQVRANHAQ